MRTIGVGLIGTGFMGKCHALAFRAVPAIFEDTLAPELAILADVDAKTLAAQARAWGFARWTSDWREVVTDDAVDLVAITTPNFLHKEMALAALRAGKHVYCEKPLACDARDARSMADAADQAGVRTLVGYNYLHNPVVGLAKDLIDSGEIGEVVHFQGVHFEDYMADPQAPATWRCRKAMAGAGALGDLGSHVMSLAHHLVGEIVEVMGALQTVIPERPRAGAREVMEAVDVDDQVQALVRFAGGAAGTIEASWIAAGRKMGLAIGITGTKGALRFDQERLNELQLFTHGQRRRLDGFRTILAGPDHPPYASFCPAPGHQLGFNDLKVIEVKALLDGIASGAPLGSDFHAAWRIARVVDAVQLSARERRWVRPEEV